VTQVQLHAEGADGGRETSRALLSCTPRAGCTLFRRAFQLSSTRTSAMRSWATAIAADTSVSDRERGEEFGAAFEALEGQLSGSWQMESKGGSGTFRGAHRLLGLG
jgi:hypothetical protein